MIHGTNKGRRASGPASRLWIPVRLVLAVVLVALLALVGVGCTTQDNTSSQQQGSTDTSANTTGNQGADTLAPGSVPVRVASLKGPTSIGLVDFMDKASNPDATSTLMGAYSFQISGTADEILPSMVSGDLDIALVPANVASVLYNRTNGGVTAISINTLGALYVVSADASITSLQDLAGRTVLMTGKGTTPDYVMNYLLKQNGLDGKVDLEYKSEATELAAAVSADPTAIALLPEPYVTAVTSKNPDLAVRLSLADEWQKLEGDQGGQLVAGVTLVRTAFLNQYPQVVQEFLSNQADSVASVLADPAAASQLVVSQGIIDDAQVAQTAIPRCNLVCLEGSQMQTALSSYLQVLYAADPTSVGGTLPGTDFYYLGQ